MKKVFSLITVFSLALACVPLRGYGAVDLTEEEVSPRSRRIYLEPQKGIIERGVFKSLAAFTAGFDNNAHLNSSRDDSPYFQMFYKGVFTTPLDELTKAALAYEFMSLLYSNENDLSVVRNSFGGQLEHKLADRFIVSGGYTFDSVEYIKSGDDDYVENTFDARLRQNLDPAGKLYHSLLYSLSYRVYEQRFTRYTATMESDKERMDLRNTFEYEIGKFMEKDFVKAFIQYYYNNSNEKYLSYYDYDSWKAGASWTHIFDKKLSSYLSLFRQYRHYRTRTLVNDPGSRQNDVTYLFNSALYYNLSRSLTLGVGYTYRENDSNEPSENYSGSLFAISTYYRF